MGWARTRETTIPGAETGTETETGTSRRRAPSAGNNVAKAIGFLPEERGQSAPQILSAPYDPHGPAVLAAPDLPAPWPEKPDDHSIACQGAGQRAYSCCIRQDLFFVQGFVPGRPPGIPQGDSRIAPVCSRDVPVDSSDILVTSPVSPGRDGKDRKGLLSLDKTVTKRPERKQTARRSVCQGLSAFPSVASNP